MANASLDGFKVDPSLYHHGSTAMAKVMEADVLQIVLLHKSLPLLGHGLRTEGLSIGLTDHKTRVGKSCAHGQLIDPALDGYSLEGFQLHVAEVGVDTQA